MRQFKILIIALALSIAGTSISLPTNTTETFAATKTATKTIKLNKKSLTLKEGQLYRLELLNKKVRAWKTTDRKVATVIWGLVQGKGAGTCYIKAYPVKSSKVYKCKVTVKSKNGKPSTTETKKPETTPTETKPTNTNTIHFKEENNMYFGSCCKLHLLDENGNDISDQAYWKTSCSDSEAIVSKDGLVYVVTQKNMSKEPLIINVIATYKSKDYNITVQTTEREYFEKKWENGEISYSFILDWSNKVKRNSINAPEVIETSDGSKYATTGSKMYENGELVTRNAFKYLTEQEFAKVLEQIKTQYPAGTYWGLDTKYKSKSGGIHTACSGFVAMVTDTAVGCTSHIGCFIGKSGYCWEIHKVNSPSELKLYDIICYCNHTAIITGFTENGVLVCEGNHGAEVHWDCAQSYDEIFEWNNVHAGSFINH